MGHSISSGIVSQRPSVLVSSSSTSQHSSHSYSISDVLFNTDAHHPHAFNLELLTPNLEMTKSFRINRSCKSSAPSSESPITGSEGCRNHSRGHFPSVAAEGPPLSGCGLSWCHPPCGTATAHLPALPRELSARRWLPPLPQFGPGCGRRVRRQRTGRWYGP